MRTGSPDTRLIVLRGNSGSGKTSVARAVRAAYGRGLALVGHHRYGAMLRSLRRDHAGTSAFFYLDVSFPETLRRHDSRPQRSDFTPDQMREWYQERDLLPDGCETVIGEDSPLEASVRQVLRQV
ncbi:kinase [Microbispora catharanthi]|uniref:Kinase n=1 Tax=Microbispora catharanthi TaxID=1712871 RepID=A0A5N6BKC3_9ACTN|nr:kinase [Microbispora catharanthi]KAB8180932.1 hypothetical protein FH610_030275 [Microbispora catharanthi]